jgi:cell shape-determining protein MreD
VIAACCEAKLSLLLSGLLGLMLDGLSTERLGVHLAIAVLLAFSLQLLQPLWRSRSVAALVAMVLWICAAWRTLAPVACAMSVGRTVDPHRIMTIAVQEAAWTAAAACLLILAVRGLIGRHAEERTSAASVGQRWGAAVR